jgi:hypothetical protein
MGKHFTAAVLLIVVAAGCNKSTSSGKPEGTYKGKRESEWLKLCDDRSPQTRTAAWEALQYFFDDRAQAKMEEGLRADADPIATSAAAQYFAIQRPADSVDALRRLLKQGGSSQASDPHFRAAVQRLGARAKPLLPDLQALAGDKASGGQSGVQETINLIPR